MWKRESVHKKRRMETGKLKKEKKKKISLFSDNLLYGYSFFPC